MTKITWSRYGGYEISSRGDKRFSAMFAVMPDGRTLEMHYQCDVKGYQPGGTNWRLGKGKPPFDRTKDLWPEYVALWRTWAERHPHDMEMLRWAAEPKNVLSDMFATTPINQAHALATLLNERVWVHIDRP